jgi:hypothetical protein
MWSINANNQIVWSHGKADILFFGCFVCSKYIFNYVAIEEDKTTIYNYEDLSIVKNITIDLKG